MHLGPLGFLLLYSRFEEMIRGLWGLGRELVGFSPLWNKAEVVVDFANNAGLFPGLTFGGILSGRFVRLPTAFGEHPAAAAGGLYKEHVVLVRGERNNTCD